MTSDRLHRARGTGELRVNEIDGTWYARHRDGRDPQMTELERWWTYVATPVLEGITAWVIFPLAFWIATFFIVRSLLPQVR